MKVAIVELSESHEECIFTQVSFLKNANHNVSLVVHPKVAQQIQDYKNLLDEVEVIDFDLIKGVKKYKLEYKIAQKLKVFDKVIFNTASSSKSVRNINVMLTFSKVECIGIIHSVNKLNKSFTQKIISKKIKKYLALSDYLKESIELKDKNLQLESFYPIFFPEFKKSKFKPDNEIWICIPGRVHFNRRDYQWLLATVQNVEIDAKIKFLILGNIKTEDGILFKREVDNYGLKDNFIFFDGFISNVDYYNYIDNSDYILPLLQNEEVSYLKDKITGTFNLAYAFKKILLCDDFYIQIPDLRENAIFYQKLDFVKFINSISSMELKDVYYKNQKWNYEYQANKYVNFIFNQV